MERKYKIEGMSCGHCRSAVEEALNSIPGASAIVSLANEEATIDYALSELSIKELQEIVSKAGEFKITAI